MKNRNRRESHIARLCARAHARLHCIASLCRLACVKSYFCTYVSLDFDYVVLSVDIRKTDLKIRQKLYNHTD